MAHHEKSNSFEQELNRRNSEQNTFIISAAIDRLQTSEKMCQCFAGLAASLLEAEKFTVLLLDRGSYHPSCSSPSTVLTARP